jgi:hypothetical protein
MSNRQTYPGLEGDDFLISHSISLGNNRNQVDLGMQSAHDFNVQWLQSVACWLNEVDTRMNSVVNNVHAIDLVLRIQVGIKALLNVVHNWSPRLIIVYEITKTRGINNSQT